MLVRKHVPRRNFIRNDLGKSVFFRASTLQGEIAVLTCMPLHNRGLEIHFGSTKGRMPEHTMVR